jgi:molybdenum cofactor cytidylyltransferase
MPLSPQAPLAPLAPLAIVPAAGKAERFGGAKLVARIHGETVIDRAIGSLLDGGVDRIVVVIAPGADLTAAHRLSDHRVQLVVNDDPARGMFSSIQTGLGVAGGDPVLILPADMPFVSSETVAAIIAACRHEQTIVMPAIHGRRGHPIAFPASLHRAVLFAPVTASLKEALADTGVRRVELAVQDEGILRDVDVPGDLGV